MAMMVRRFCASKNTFRNLKEHNPRGALQSERWSLKKNIEMDAAAQLDLSKVTPRNAMDLRQT